MNKTFHWFKTNNNVIAKSEKKRLWFVERNKNMSFLGYRIDKIIAAKKTPYQKAVLAYSEFFGKILIIDEEIQSVEYDEVYYHEALVHPALLMHPKPKTALIIGAGEGATARELLKSKTIKKIVMVDIDREIIDFAKKYMYSWHRGSFDNKKTELIIMDAKNFVHNTNMKFDIVISDLPCPVPNGPAGELYTIEFYRKLNSVMNKNAILAVQAGPFLTWNFDFHKTVYASLKRIFKTTRSYRADVASFFSPWSFIYASKSGLDPLLKKAKFFDKVINNTIKGGVKTIDGLTLEGMFRIAKSYRRRIAGANEVSRQRKPKSFKISSTI